MPPAGAEKTKVVPCPWCESATRSHFFIERADFSFSTRICPDCRFIFQHPTPPESNLVAMYGEDYYTGKRGFAYKDERPNRHFEDFVFRARLKTIRRYAPGGGRFLDIGCSFGGLLDNAAKWYETWGVDISEYAAAYARRQGHQARAGIFPDAGLVATLPSRGFQVITLIETIEHLPWPRRVMAALDSLLGPGGLLVIQTANMSARQARRAGSSYHYYLPGHLSYFSARHFYQFARENNYQCRIFYPVDFGLLPKLRKSRGDFRSWRDYVRWLRIARYHLTGKLRWGYWAWQSSMVVYLRKGGKTEIDKTPPTGTL